MKHTLLNSSEYMQWGWSKWIKSLKYSYARESFDSHISLHTVLENRAFIIRISKMWRAGRPFLGIMA